MMKNYTTRPHVGQTVVVRGMTCTIIAVRKFGTIDVEAPDGRRFRVSGLAFI